MCWIPVAPDPRKPMRLTRRVSATSPAIWKPPFISRLTPEDRCHLNDLVMRDGKPAYVTIMSQSDPFDGGRI